MLAVSIAEPAFAASAKDEWWDEACAEKTASRWCAPRLREGGWTLKYRSRNPDDLTDVFWLIEVWVRGSNALVCEYKGGRGGVRANGCYSAVEVK